MKVKYLKGEKKPDYFVVMPSDDHTETLAPEIQSAIQKLGHLTIVKQDDLTGRTDKLSSEILKKIGEQGAYLGKVNIKITEVEGVQPP
jgi:hypothetical protein